MRPVPDTSKSMRRPGVADTTWAYMMGQQQGMVVVKGVKFEI
jgi:hypothetical protein